MNIFSNAYTQQRAEQIQHCTYKYICDYTHVHMHAGIYIHFDLVSSIQYSKIPTYYTQQSTAQPKR